VIMRSSPVAQIAFDSARVSADRLIGDEGGGFRIAMSALDSGRLGIAACAVGLAQAALDYAVAYSRERDQFGQRIIDFQGLGFMLADMATQVSAARALTLSAARLRDAGRRYSAEAAKAKLFATDTAMKVTTDAVQVLGGYGYVTDHPVERYMREAKVLQIVEGTNQIQRLVISRALARTNIEAFGDGDEAIVVNSAGCGALMKEYGHLLGDERGQRFGARVRDVTELLAGDAMKGPAPGAPLDLHVAYDPPCHLLHAQGVAAPPLKLFAAIPLLELVQVPGAAECCGSAGLFTLLEPEMSRAVLATKLERLREAAPQVVATGNPGCLMQLGAGLAAVGLRAQVRHPVELLDDAYRAAGRYE